MTEAFKKQPGRTYGNNGVYSWLTCRNGGLS
jgi:hypothetical protein